MSTTLPESILIVGGGVFGLSTALALLEDRAYPGPLTLLDASPLPNPDGSSVDASRIIRADYAKPAYASLAADAVHRWRTTPWGSNGRFTPSGLLLYATKSDHGYGVQYCRDGYENVRRIYPGQVQALHSREDMVAAAPGYARLKADPEAAYVNWGSGWGHAEESVRYAKERLEASGRVTFVRAAVKRLVTRRADDGREEVAGVELADGRTIAAALTVLATGAWTGALVDLRGRAEATGQAVAFVRITDEEQARLRDMPVMLDIGTGMFVIPPRENLLKVARHGFGYRNPVKVARPLGAGEGEGQVVEYSVARANAPLPLEGEVACREGLRRLVPEIAERPFEMTRVCWYTDTPNGDFIISYHPQYAGLFLATGGSGHAFKFFPNIGEKIVDAIEGKLDPELAKLWTMKDGVRPEDVTGELVCNDGSRAGARGLVLEEELRKSGKSRL